MPVASVQRTSGRSWFGKYELLAPLGAGGMAEVFLARASGPHGFERLQVIKRILPRLCADDRFVSMFVAEAKLSSLLAHGNIVQVYDFGEIEGQLYMAMEYVEGTDLRRLLRWRQQRGETVPVAAAAYAVREILRALAYAHDKIGPDGASLGLVHRDVSPSNVLLSCTGEVKLCDFGVAKARSVRRTESGALRGKLCYMSPEQAHGAPVDAASDIFAAGIVLWEMLAGTRLFHDDSDLGILAKVRAAVVPDLKIAGDDRLRATVRRALERRRDERHPDAASFARELDEFLVASAAEDPARTVAELVRTSIPEQRPRISMTAVHDTTATTSPGPQGPDVGQTVSALSHDTEVATVTDPSARAPDRRTRPRWTAAAMLGAAALVLLGWALWPASSDPPAPPAAASTTAPLPSGAPPVAPRVSEPPRPAAPRPEPVVVTPPPQPAALAVPRRPRARGTRRARGPDPSGSTMETILDPFARDSDR